MSMFTFRTSHKTRRQQQRERHQTKGLMSKAMVLYKRCNSWYTLPSYRRQQREMINFCFVGVREPQRLIFRISFVAYSAVTFTTHSQTR